MIVTMFPEPREQARAIGVATALLAVRLVRRDRGIGLGQGADVWGGVLVTGALMLGVYTILEAGDYGWGSLHTLGLGAVALALLAAFVARTRRALDDEAQRLAGLHQAP
jgi:hypothetical protein